MNTTIYLINASRFDTLKVDYKEKNMINSNKNILSVSSEDEAKKIFSNRKFDGVSKIYTSNSISSQELGRYIASKNDLIISSTEKLDEREIGNMDKLDGLDLGIRQTKDFDFRLNGGESLNQVKKRMSVFLKNILAEYKEKEIAIISHDIAIMSLLTNWCKMDYNLDNKVILTFKDEVVYDETSIGKDILKITFEDVKLKGIELLEL